MSTRPPRLRDAALRLLLASAVIVVVAECDGGGSGVPVGERLTAPGPKARIEVSKALRELRLYSGGELLRRYRAGLGFEPVADKTREGDGATPEGEYLVCVKNPRSRYYLSLGLSYPNAADAERGLASRRISAAESARIADAARRGVCPPWNTALGGEIFIHGRGSRFDWTRGCVALDDADMKELFAAVEVGTPVIVEP